MYHILNKGGSYKKMKNPLSNPENQAKFSKIIIDCIFYTLPLIIVSLLSLFFKTYFNLDVSKSFYIVCVVLTFSCVFLQLNLLKNVINKNNKYSQSLIKKNLSIHYYIMILISLIYLVVLNHFMNVFSSILLFLQISYISGCLYLIQKQSSKSK